MTGRSLLLACEAALLAVTLAVVLGMSRLFADGGWLGPLAVNAVAAHAVAGVLRRRGTALPLTALAMAAGAVLVGTWTSYWWTTTAGMPTGATWTAMGDDLSSAWTLYQDAVAPAPVEAGFVLASGLALWGIAYVADWAAFRLWVPFEATLPAGTLFLFTALLGVERGRGWSVALFAGAFITFLLLHRMTRQASSSHWVAERRVQGQRSLLTAGATLGIVAVLAGTTLGPSLPGASSPGVIDPRALRSDTPQRVTISPLVDIRARMVDQADVEVFQVRSAQDSYWRLTSLDAFDGRKWSISSAFDGAESELPSAEPLQVETQAFQQTFTIEALAVIWLPAAFEPTTLDASDSADVLYDDESATLIVDSEVDSSNGLVYTVTSTSPRTTAADLAGAAGDIPGSIAERFLGLPDDFSPQVEELATTVTAGATTPYAQALAVQDHLRTFTYDIEARSGQSEDVLEEFLFITQRGYCEQFAGAFAAMARSVGLPSRVAVGFTQGVVDPAEPGVYRVRGEHAHAWPEVYLAGAGWLPFEPTPGRGIPFAEPYTGVAPSQAATGQPQTATTVPSATTLPVGAETPVTGPQVRDDILGTTGGAVPETDVGDDGTVPVQYVLRPLRTLAPVIPVLALAYCCIVPAAFLLHRWLRRRRARTGEERVRLAWVEAAEAAELAGYREAPSDTFTERAERMALRLPAAADEARLLAHHQELTEYSQAGIGEEEAASSAELAHTITVAARCQATRWQRIAPWLDLRPLLVGRWRARGLRQRHITTPVLAPAEEDRVLVDSRR